MLQLPVAKFGQLVTLYIEEALNNFPNAVGFIHMLPPCTSNKMIRQYVLDITSISSFINGTTLRPAVRIDHQNCFEIRKNINDIPDTVYSVILLALCHSYVLLKNIAINKILIKRRLLSTDKDSLI